MIINHNYASIQIYSELNRNIKKVSKSMEKLSSGLRINRAAAAATGAYDNTTTMSFTVSADQAAKWTAIGDKTGTQTGTITDNGLSIDTTALSGAADSDTVHYTASPTATNTAQLFDSSGVASIGSAITIDKANGGTYMLGNTATGQLNVTFGANQATTGNTTVNVTTTAATAAKFDANNHIKLSDASAAGGIDVSSSADAASKAITTIDNAINTVSAERAKLGAYSNRLDNTINNLNTSSQNTSDAQSRIANVDMAKEMMNQSKSSVLAQAAQAMLAMANQQPQQVLQLLR
jgi:flagellin